MDRRLFLQAIGSLGIGAAVTGTLAGCGSDGASTAGQPPGPPTGTGPIEADIAFAMYPGYLALMKELVFDPFVAKNPGVKISPLEGPASQTYAQLLASPTGSRAIQGGMMNDALSWSGVKAELWQPMSVEQVPNLAKVPEALRNTAGTPWAVNAFGITYNPEKIPGGIQSWKDLYAPALKGKVAMWPAYFDAYIMAAVAEDADDTEVEKGIEAWSKAKDNIGMWITSIADLHQAMDRGEIWAAPDYMGTAIRDAKAGMKLAFALPSEGAVLNTYQLEVVSGISPEQTRAMAGLIDLILSEPVQQAAFSRQFLTPANSSVKVDASAGQIQGLESYSFTAADAAKQFYKVDYKWVGENTSTLKKLIEDKLK